MDLEHALNVNDTARSVEFANELKGKLIDLASKHAYVSGDGFDHYMIYDSLGRAAFKAVDYKLAAENLQKAAEIPPNTRDTVRLDYFGPSLWLAEQLMHVGKKDEVLLFLRTCKARFWSNDASDRADKWIADMMSGKSLDMSPNSGAGYGYTSH